MLLSSCIPDPLEVKNIPVVKPEIVVATQMLEEETLLVLLTKTFGALEVTDDSDPLKLVEQIAVRDATVSISGPGGSYELSNMGYGVYGGVNIPFEEGETYELHVSSETLGAVHASAVVQKKVKFEQINADLYYNEEGDTLAHLTYSLEDPREKNWYLMGVQEIRREHIIHNFINPRAHTELIDDYDVPGEGFTDQHRVIPRVYDPGDTIVVSLSNISEEYYEFMKIRLDNRHNFMEFLGEPVHYPSNIVGGKGFFNLNVPDFKTFVFDQ
ncbi:DUF4249 family protein [Cesiribacter sp. SM1]|uniref:DUF4249 family protein n=1 Tax=Cesiribacter sp. SM1 TaxID=2861196 RepID=UPI001CD557B3|nr:DUF4249 family protein [Cesiribacter sp. SM1]